MTEDGPTLTAWLVTCSVGGEAMLVTADDLQPYVCTQHVAGRPIMDSPEDGHRFTITFTSQGSYAVEGVPGHTDSKLPPSEPHSVTVRAWDLRAALRLAATLPMSAWYEKEFEAERLEKETR
jgi:hypothetical protein